MSNKTRKAMQSTGRQRSVAALQRWAFLLAVVIVAGVLLGLCFVVAEVVTAGHGSDGNSAVQVLLPRGS